jgi:thymidylate synthase (FAD)
MEDCPTQPRFAQAEKSVVVLRSDMRVELIDSMASDSAVVRSARVSVIGDRTVEAPDAERDTGLVNYLMRNGHGLPFEHAMFTFYVEAPIFVWREVIRHRIASYNEESARYRKLKPVFYVPDSFRIVRQGGTSAHPHLTVGTAAQHEAVEAEFITSSTAAYSAYERLLAAGIAREVARMVLPVNIYSSAYVTMNARALMNFLSLRVEDEGMTFPSHPMHEIELVARKFEAIFAEAMPMTHRAFLANGFVAP